MAPTFCLEIKLIQMKIVLISCEDIQFHILQLACHFSCLFPQYCNIITLFTVHCNTSTTQLSSDGLATNNIKTDRHL